MKLKIKWSNVKYSKRGAWLKSRYCTAQLASLVAAFECVFTFFNIRTSHLHREIKTGGGPRLSKILLIKHCKERNRNPQNLTWIKKTSIFEILMVMGGFIKQSHYWLPHAHTNTNTNTRLYNHLPQSHELASSLTLTFSHQKLNLS